MNSKAALPILACICIALLLIGFTGKSLSQNAESSSAAGAVNASSSAITANIEKYVFPKDKVVDVKITIAPEDFQDMLDNAAAEELKTASIEYNGIKFDNVGIRTKGNLSLRSVVNSESDRYSFKISFDEYLTNQTFYGIDKINLNNNYSDATYMREYLSYELAKEMGLPTPEYSFVNVYVNGELKGFYLAVEQIGDSYLERNFGNSSGALYKAVQGTGTELKWLGADTDSYPGLVQKSKALNDDILLDMLDELNNGTDYESVMDVEEMLKFIALNAITVNMDSYLGSNKHNYYLYENDGIFSALPWDYNMSFGGLGSSQILIDEPTQGALSERPLVDKLLQVEEYKEKYHDIIREALQGMLSSSAFETKVQQLSALISPYVEKDPTAFYTYEQYKSAVTQLVSSNAGRVQNFAQQLNGTIPSSGDGSGSGGGMGGPGGGAGGFGGGRNGGGPGQGRGIDGQQPGGNAGAGVQAMTLPAGQTGAVVQTAAANTEQAQNGQQPQNGQQAPNGQQNQNGQLPQNGQQGQMSQGGRGQFGQGGMGGGPGGMGGGMPGMDTPSKNANTAANRNEALLTAGMLVLLLLSCLFVAKFRRRRL
ncbi:spore coat protein CotH [Paenibacillus mesophilus]|uniref:CotH kinase family protein n=1 Tax=Paenibacillus mesophilus TaxID=2582849 RepID=UPI00110DE591|nr:CotH kinase family protein [Paenibacillus mesophilus]TMV46895.1 spore coat protein CotH [Paenibacillus mesophilus]